MAGWSGPPVFIVICLRFLAALVSVWGSRQVRLGHGTPSSPLAGVEWNESMLADPVTIALAECERASGPPDGLGCEREGWFVSNFENQGTWVAGGGRVPLSHAVCCRPALPDSLPLDHRPASQNLTAVALVSIGCHPSSGKDWHSLQCENTGASFITGFSHAEPVSTFFPQNSYPLGQAECCTPALLLDTGDVWELTRCDCALSDAKDCGGLSTNRLLWGFAGYRRSHSGLFLPIAPLQCCGLCLTDRVHSKADCEELDYCSGNGVCILGACQCFAGYGGPDCGAVAAADNDDGGAGGNSWQDWSMTTAGAMMLVGSAVLLRASCAYGLRHALGQRRRRTRGGEGLEGSGLALLDEDLLLDDDDDDEGGAGRRLYQGPLYLEAHAAGSVGSHDTEDVTLGHRDPEDEELGVGSEDEGEQLASDGTAGENGEILPDALEEEDGGLCPGRRAGERKGSEGVVESVADAPACPPHCHPAPGPLLRPSRCHCAVCMDRPVQVALVPCGHASLCRRCSRKLDRCPLCRREVLRRQRLYFNV